MPDAVKWAVAALLLAAGIVGFYAFGDYSRLLRIIGLLVAAGLAGAVAYQTEGGRRAIAFLKEVRAELRKVVWPTRKETMQTTGIVIAVVAVVAAILWIVDGLLALALRSLIGSGS